MTIVAHVNAIQGLTGPDQKVQVDKLVAKAHPVPKAVKRELDKVHESLTAKAAQPRKKAR